MLSSHLCLKDASHSLNARSMHDEAHYLMPETHSPRPFQIMEHNPSASIFTNKLPNSTAKSPVITIRPSALLHNFDSTKQSANQHSKPKSPSNLKTSPIQLETKFENLWTSQNKKRGKSRLNLQKMLGYALHGFREDSTRVSLEQNLESYGRMFHNQAPAVFHGAKMNRLSVFEVDVFKKVWRFY